MGKGRGNGNSVTTGEAMKLEISNLVKTQCLQVDKEINFISQWSNGAKIGIRSVYNETEIYLHLSYGISDKETKESKLIDYKIYIGKVNSNLGKGHNLYFYCPESGLRCKTLYLCYGAERFKCRQAYNNRIYYSSQSSSKIYNPTCRYFKFEKEIEKLTSKRRAKDYKGKPTKRKLRISKLYDKKENVDRIRNEYLERWLYKFMGLNP